VVVVAVVVVVVVVVVQVGGAATCSGPSPQEGVGGPSVPLCPFPRKPIPMAPHLKLVSAIVSSCVRSSSGRS